MYNHLSSATVTDCTFIGNTAHEQGGGMYNTHSSPMVLACNFVGNSAVALRVLGASSGGGPSSGGGMYNFGGSPTVHLCSFWMNTAAFGGGMGNNESAPIVTQCAFDFNSAAYGGGMSNETSSPAVTACVFDTNIASQFGGGMQNSSSSNPTVTGCSFVNNAADGGGGGMDNFASSPTVINCTFHENTVTNIGGAGIYNTNSNPSVINCTFTFNVGPAAGGMYSWANSSPVLANCILWGDSPDEFGGDGTPTVMYSNVQGGWDGNGSNNIDADPLFADPASGYLHLSSGSPCIDAGDNTAVPPDTLDLDGDGDTAEPVPFDLDGNPRFVDDPSTPDSGNGNPPLVDMGAYEFPPAAECAGDDDCPPGFLCIDGECVPYCPWDLEGDGNVGITDFLALLASWGSCDEIFTVQTAPPSESHLAIVDRDGCDIGSLPTQMAVMLGMGFDPSTDTLFATGIGAGSPSLYEIDRMSGVYTLIGTTGTIISAISIHPVTFDLYGMTLSGSLYLIDKTDGSLTLLGSDPVDLVEANGMTFSPDGTLYVSDTSGDGTSDLFVVDPATGDASLHVTIDRNSVAGLDFGADGVLYGTDNQTDTVITIDLGSGTATEVCPFGLGFGHPTLELAPGVGGPGPDCAADLDGDGVVGITDFLALLAHWGPCP
jgi:hypothetical protein